MRSLGNVLLGLERLGRAGAAEINRKKMLFLSILKYFQTYKLRELRKLMLAIVVKPDAPGMATDKILTV